MQHSTLKNNTSSRYSLKAVGRITRPVVPRRHKTQPNINHRTINLNERLASPSTGPPLDDHVYFKYCTKRTPLYRPL